MNTPPHLRQTLVWFFRAATIAVAVLAWTGLVVTALAIEYIGQHNLLTAFLMYLPSWIWALPLAMMTPFLLLAHWRLGLVALFTVGLYWGPWLGYRWSSPELTPGSSAEVRLLTWNRGEAGGESLQPFKNRVKPTVLTMQDAARRMDAYKTAPEYADLPHAAQAGEFLVLSRDPVAATEIINVDAEVPNRVGKKVSVAGRFEITGPKGVWVLYSVHFPTPRDTLSFYRRGVFVLGVAGIPGTPWAEKRREYQRYWDSQLAWHQQLLERIRQEQKPVLIAGDFNIPALGPGQRLYTQRFRDSHLEGGSGYGYTFPGRTGNPLALFASWLRLDRIYADESWTLTGQVTEAKRGSQHLAVFASYELPQ